MKNKKTLIALLFFLMTGTVLSFRVAIQHEQYYTLYSHNLEDAKKALADLAGWIDQKDRLDEKTKNVLWKKMDSVRLQVKKNDFWWRYFEANAYKKINGPLPVEWETEVFEKFELPYKREGAGLMIAAEYLGEEDAEKDSLKHLIMLALDAVEVYRQDSITVNLSSFDHFFYCNRLYLLNLAAIYTTGFECPATDRVVPELLQMMQDVSEIYKVYNVAFTTYSLSDHYLALYDSAIRFVQEQSFAFETFDHFSFLRDYVNPLFRLNQQLILDYRARSKNLLDYSLNRSAVSVFDKQLYRGQNTKGVFANIEDPQLLAQIDRLGKQLFYDPILSGNNERSCASCHNPKSFFTDTVFSTALQFNRLDRLPRNTPSLINTPYQHLIMADGAHINLQDQTKGVVLNPVEMGAEDSVVWEKLMGCKDYKKGFEQLLKYTPQTPRLAWSHVLSAITFYYSKFSYASAPFDEWMNDKARLPDTEVKAGFNLFMGKAQCATCHFVPQFNGVKPPYIGSEFEVLGTPSDPSYRVQSADSGRFGVFAAKETLGAFRTGTLRNIMKTAPYMHNGVFKSIEEVLDFYDNGGGIGHGFDLPNQTLPADSLHLSGREKSQLIAFLNSLTESVPFEDAPESLPKSANKILNQRKIGGIY